MTNNYKINKNHAYTSHNLRYFVGNWKMFGDFNSFKIVRKIENFHLKFRKKHKKCKIILCVPNILISFFKKKIKSKSVFLGAQNCSRYTEQGPFTGSVSASMLKKAGAEFVILGHSENRKEGESPQLIKKKIYSALRKNLTVIFCIGETAKEKKQGKTIKVLFNQIKKSLDKKFNLKKIIIAYEPVWSIGTGKTPSSKDLIKINAAIKFMFIKIFKINPPKVLYGGSVNDKNIFFFSKQTPFFDGFLIGGASQSSKKFIDIMRKYYT